MASNQKKLEHLIVSIRDSLSNSNRHYFHLDGGIAFRSSEVINLMFANTLFLFQFPFESYFRFNRHGLDVKQLAVRCVAIRSDQQ